MLVCLVLIISRLESQYSEDIGDVTSTATQYSWLAKTWIINRLDWKLVITWGVSG